MSTNGAIELTPQELRLIEERKAAIRAAKLAKVANGVPSGHLGDDELDQVVEPIDSARSRAFAAKREGREVPTTGRKPTHGIPWHRDAIREATAAASSWLDATARYNAATGQDRDKNRFQIKALSLGFRLPDGAIRWSSGPKPGAANAGRPRKAVVANHSESPNGSAPTPKVSPATEAGIRPERADEWDAILAAIRVLSPLGIAPATLRKVADILACFESAEGTR